MNHLNMPHSGYQPMIRSSETMLFFFNIRASLCSFFLMSIPILPLNNNSLFSHRVASSVRSLSHLKKPTTQRLTSLRALH